MDNSTGHNNIVIVPGANDELTPAMIDEHSALICSAKVLLTQLEVPLDSTIRALEIGAKSDATTVIFNPAPANASLPDSMYALCDLIIPNETEAELLTGVAV